MTNFPEPQTWWDQLSDETQTRLLANNPLNEVPGDLILEVVKAGAPVTGAWFTATENGPDKLSLPRTFEEFLEAQRHH
ncbi:hypothetical protein [[Micrococcus luteus] ATCC 49442]|uniref:hypothetical protein n=1 Tax=[Micrococcus luteus] ATCC 49442 TaxID=2698727 RepID=UPI0013D978F4|nr:hypothetical protein [[Micrococcus luteus] ATCC 49442]